VFASAHNFFIAVYASQTLILLLIKTQMADAVLDHNCGSEYPSKSITEGRPLNCKCVFVQTNSGPVLGIELEPEENAHTVKKKLQLALNVPTEESSLTFGDQVFNNDLTYVRNDSPLLLTRNHMHRSCSTPCLSPKGKECQQHDQCKVIEILSCSSPSAAMKELVKDIIKGITNGVDPVAVTRGMGGAYYFWDLVVPSCASCRSPIEPRAPMSATHAGGACSLRPESTGPDFPSYMFQMYVSSVL
jgi:hypothetical protein